jgi:hypothetical protein
MWLKKRNRKGGGKLYWGVYVSLAIYVAVIVASALIAKKGLTLHEE